MSRARVGPEERAAGRPVKLQSGGSILKMETLYGSVRYGFFPALSASIR